MIAVERNDVSVVVPEKTVTVVGASPLNVVVTKVSDTVSVVARQQVYSVVTRPVSPIVVSVQKPVTVVSGSEQKGPKIFFSPTPPLGAKLNDIWIRTT